MEAGVLAAMAVLAAAAAVRASRAGVVGLLPSIDPARSRVVLTTASAGVDRMPQGQWRRRRRVMRERAALDREIPQLLDLLAAASAAGLSAPLALRHAGAALRGPLGDELRAMFATTDLGERWRDGFGALTERLEIHDLRRIHAVLVRTETLGASLSDATSDLAESIRQSRRSALMERARAAPVKMLFPLVFLILPAFLLLTVVPVLLATVRSIG